MSADVNSVRHNGAGLLQPISEESIVGVLTRRKIDPKANWWGTDHPLWRRLLAMWSLDEVILRVIFWQTRDDD